MSNGIPTCHPSHRRSPWMATVPIWNFALCQVRREEDMSSDVPTPLPGHHVLFFLLPQAHCIPPCLRISEHRLWYSALPSKCPTLTAHTWWATYHYSLAATAIKLSPIMTLARSSQHSLHFRLDHSHCYCWRQSSWIISELFLSVLARNGCSDQRL